MDLKYQTYQRLLSTITYDNTSLTESPVLTVKFIFPYAQTPSHYLMFLFSAPTQITITLSLNIATLFPAELLSH